MSDEKLIWNLYEANLISKNPLHLELEKVLKEKNVTKQPIKDWLLKTYIKWFTSPNEDNLKTDFVQKYQAQESDPDWAKKEDVMQFKGFTPQYLEKLNHIVDFLDSRDENYLKSLYKVTIPQMDIEVQKWDEQMRAASEKAQKEKVQSVRHKDYYVEGDYDGYQVWGLKSNKAFREESLFMGHCVGQSDTDKDGVKSLEGGESNYFKEFKKGKLAIYSLRDPSKNYQPVVTFEVHKPFMAQDEVQQIKGRYNEAPDIKYWKACELFIRDQRLIVKQDGDLIGMKYWREKERYYFNREFKTILKKYIIPQRNTIIEDIRGSLTSGNVYEADIDLSELYFDELPDLSDIIVQGSFVCSNNNLKNLKGSPQYVTESFRAEYCNLESLEGAPRLVGYVFSVDGHKLKTLEHSPYMIGNDYCCRHVIDNGHEILSLKGCTKTIGGCLRFNQVHPDLLKDLRGLEVASVHFFSTTARKYVSFDEDAFETYGVKSHPDRENNLYVDRVQDMIKDEIQKREDDIEQKERGKDNDTDREYEEFVRLNHIRSQYGDDDDDIFGDEDSEEVKVESFKKFFRK